MLIQLSLRTHRLWNGCQTISLYNSFDLYAVNVKECRKENVSVQVDLR